MRGRGVVCYKHFCGSNRTFFSFQFIEEILCVSGRETLHFIRVVRICRLKDLNVFQPITPNKNQEATIYSLIQLNFQLNLNNGGSVYRLLIFSESKFLKSILHQTQIHKPC